jgi:hypothetical protein
MLRWILADKRWLELANDRGTEQSYVRLLLLKCDDVNGKVLLHSSDLSVNLKIGQIRPNHGVLLKRSFR